MKYVLDTCTYYWLNDPADRFIIATANLLGAKILSPDSILPKYPGSDVVW